MANMWPISSNHMMKKTIIAHAGYVVHKHFINMITSA